MCPLSTVIVLKRFMFGFGVRTLDVKGVARFSIKKMPPFCSPSNFKFKYFYYFHNLKNSTPLVMFHDVNLGSSRAIASTLCNILEP